ncbi:nucleoside/nucleotide kinase family protein [Agromyces rhizosphaerae]|uniref:Nucleoside/nucleotide kinase family protein n=1 Tax=Agromyces rhizosphaerae TaxID=88374 RepID=A0A9W6CUA2_9MICO|nr:nucleoside/nucleotide kinase family protein [Agromyces rhizosphaerae]GLI26515.1 nucleoside/nucleotide kinase family protein [Agromyces rhizosphaerae]
MELDALVERAVALAEVGPAGGGARAILGIAGAPGAGKSTLAAAVAAGVAARGIRTALLPMDGFHLADVELARLGRLDRKGAIDTFDGWGYLAVLRRVRESRHTVYAPNFERTLEQPIAGAVAIEPGVELVVTEGNYLLMGDEPWSLVPAVLAETWFVDAPDDVRRARLVARHVEFGKSPDAAAAWVRDVDEPNARAVIARRDAADLVVRAN